MEFLSGPHLIDLVIGVTLLEGLALMAYHRASGKGVAPRDFIVNWLSGLCLMFALRAAVAAAWWGWAALWLLAAGLAHAVDLWARWRR